MVVFSVMLLKDWTFCICSTRKGPRKKHNNIHKHDKYKSYSNATKRCLSYVAIIYKKNVAIVCDGLLWISDKTCGAFQCNLKAI